MLILLYDLLTQYIIPGMMLAFGICLFFLSIPDREGLKNYIFARKVVGTTFIVYSMGLICEAASRNPLAGDLLNSMIVIAIGITQAFLFTYSLIALLDIGFLTKRTACSETMVVVAGIVAVFILYAFCSPGSRQLVFYVFSLCYLLLMARYVALFRHYYKRYCQLMDNYFSDDERQRLYWVPVAFYSAFGVGVVALLFAWQITPLTQLLFMVTAMVYYTVFAVRFMNYVYIFPKIKEPLEDTVCEATAVTVDVMETPSDTVSECNVATEDDLMLMEQIDRLMKEQTLFKTPDLSIARVAALCGKSHRVVSMAINHCRGVNFKTYVNEYRVAESVRLIEQGWLKQHTLDALASEAGFAGRVNLYRAFKRKTGVSPTDWEVKPY